MSSKQLVAFILTMVMSIHVGQAAYFDDDSGDGLWTTDENWDTDFVPGAGEDGAHQFRLRRDP